MSQSTRDACLALSAAYARALDFRDHEGLPELFSEQGRLLCGASDLAGRDAIWHALQQRPADLLTRHLFANGFVEALTEHSARGLVYLSLYAHRGTARPAPLEGPQLVGHFEDRFCRQDGRWLFESRRLQVAFATPLGLAAAAPDAAAALS